jgi:hypothetical protein
VRAIRCETIATHEQPTGISAHSGEERLYIIDRRTNAPTLHVRRLTPQLALEEIVEDEVLHEQVLLYGHITHHNKHYAFFLDFPRLFSVLKNRIETWLAEQFDNVAKQDGAAPWRAFVYSPDRSLHWASETLRMLPQRPDVRYLSEDDLAAPPALSRDRHAAHCVVVLPALVTGRSLRRAIEYVSRLGPRTILVACVASRMDPEELNFLLGITHYGSARLRIACFLDIPLKAYTPGAESCPLCREIKELERLADAVRRSASATGRLWSALRDKLQAKQPLQVDVRQATDPSLYNRMSRGDVHRARIASLYYRARVDIKARRKLNELLCANASHQDAFLQVLSWEAWPADLSIAELEDWLYKAMRPLMDRVTWVFEEAAPPFPLASVCRALVFLSPLGFHERVTELVRRYAASIRDVEEICVRLLLEGSMPPGLGKLLEDLRASGQSDTEQVVGESERLLASFERGRSSGPVEDVVDLWARLARSSAYSEPILTTAAQSERTIGRWSELSEVLSRALDHYYRDVSPLLSRLRASPVWRAIADDRGGAQCRLGDLELRVGQLRELVKTVPSNAANENQLLHQAILQCQSLNETHDRISSHIFKFIFCPVHCLAARLPATLPRGVDPPVDVVLDIDRSIGLILADPAELDTACAELVTNWRAHADGPMPRARFKLHVEAAHVVFEFADNFSGDFNLGSRGGLHIVQEFCWSYGGHIQTGRSGGEKVLAMRLPLLTGVSRSSRRPYEEAQGQTLTDSSRR